MMSFLDGEREDHGIEPSNTSDEQSSRVSPDEHMDPNRIAALIEGRLSKPEREHLVASIGDADAAAGILSDAIAALGEAEVVHPVRSAPRRSWHPGVWLALAAGIAGILLFPLAQVRIRGASAGGLGRYAMMITERGTRIPADWNDSPWDATRGAKELSAEARAFRIGVRVTDLGVAVRTGDSSAARWASETASLIDPIPGAGPVAAMYSEIAAKSARPGPSSAALVDSVARATAELPDAELVRLGAWVEAARLAAAARDARFFASGESRALLREAVRSHAAPAARGAIEQLVRSTSEPGDLDWPRVQTELVRVASVIVGQDQAGPGAAEPSP